MEEKQLFGGAIRALLPERFADASQLREVPDNQEVFIDMKGTDQSVIVEVLEMLPAAEDGASPAVQHFWVLADDNGAMGSSQVLTAETIPDHPFLKDAASVTYCLGQQAISKFRENLPGSQNLVDVHVAVFRIPSKQTDLVVSFNHPISLGEKSSSIAAVDVNDAIMEGGDVALQFRQIVYSLNIVDWGLFA
ncbi:hypothetical protein HDU96_004040 [Phlyctochytrium bullatum]|nr:hypothetical protein HDU96_004040 [Phlyctochytrium bullatum]